KWNPRELPFEHIQSLFTILFIQLLRDPMTQINGFKIIHDFKGTSVQHLKFCTPRNLHLLYHGAINCVPGRYKEIHFVNDSFVLKTLWTILKPFLSEKIRNRGMVTNMSAQHEFNGVNSWSRDSYKMTAPTEN
ncbi:hypothetical protein AVEN_219392-1, partial [Araneus ventricosus]